MSSATTSKNKLRLFSKRILTSSQSSSVNSLEPSAPITSPGASGTGPILSQRSDGLHNFGVALDLLRNVGEGSEVLAPLKAICGGLKVLVDIAETIQQNDEDLRELHTKLGRQLGHLEQQHAILTATKSKVSGKEVGNLVNVLKAYIIDLNKIQEVLNALKDEGDRHIKKLFKKVWKFNSTREDIKGCTRQLDGSFQLCVNSLLGFIAHQTILMRNDLANDAISRLPCADARGNQHDSCLEGTRIYILNEISRWVTDGSAEPVLGLIDQAGTGKSTISIHLAEHWEEQGICTARFFFSLPQSVTTATDLATTLARDLAHANATLRTLILEAINDHPNLTGYSIKQKLDWFVLTPLKRLREDYTKLLDQVQKDMDERSYMKSPEIINIDITGNSKVVALEKLYVESLEAAQKHQEDETYRSALHQAHKEYMEGLEDACLYTLAHPPVIILDALDECSLNDRAVVLDAMLNSLSEPSDTYSFKLFLTCRPEGDITSKFQNSHHDNLFRRVHFRMSSKIPSNHYDITLYANRYLADVLSPEQILLFIARASNLFIWASTAKAFITEALDPSALFESLVSGNDTNSPLDSLYGVILRSAAEKVGSSQLGILKKVLQATCVARTPMCTSSMDEILELGRGVSQRVVTRLGSVLSNGETVQVLHPTFIEYFQAGKQPKNLLFTKEESETVLASGCLNTLCSHQLKYDICGILQPLQFAPKNRDVGDLQQRIEKSTSPGLRYAAIHGLSHVTSALQADAVVSSLRRFWETNLLHWIELMSLLGEVLHLLRSVHDLMSYIDEAIPQHTNIVMTEHRNWCKEITSLIQPFHSRIETSAMQVYFSALPFAPPTSKISHAYHQRFKNKIPTVVTSPVTPQYTVLAAHTGRITCLSFSPDGKTLATGSDDESVCFWDVRTGVAFRKPQLAHAAQVTCLAFSPDGRMLATGSHDDKLQLWDATVGTPIGEWMEGHTDWVACLAFSPDGERIATGSHDNSVRLWDVTTRTQLGKPLVRHYQNVVCLAFSSDGQRLATGSQDSTICLWDAITGTPIGEPLALHSGGITCLAFSPNGRRLATGSRDSTIRLWNATTGVPIGEPLIGHTDAVRCLAFSPNGRVIATGSHDSTTWVWDVMTGMAIGNPLAGHTHWVTSLDFSPDGRRIATGSYDRTVRLWDTSNGAPIGEPLVGHANELGCRCLSFSPDGRRIASGSHDTTVRLWDVTNDAVIRKPSIGHTKRITCFAFSLDAQRLATGSYDGTIRFWDTTTGAPIGQPLEEAARFLSFSPDGQKIATGSLDYKIRLWDVATGAPIGKALVGHTDAITRLSFSPDGQRLVSGSSDHTLRLWEPTPGTAINKALVGHTDAIAYTAFSPDGRMLASGSIDSTVRFWDIATGVAIGEPLIGHTEKITCLSFSNDGRRLVTSSTDGTIRRWDFATRTAIGEPLRQYSFVHSLKYHVYSAGSFLLVNSSNLWDLSEEPPTRISAQYSRDFLSSLSHVVSFERGWTYVHSSAHTCFSLPSGFRYIAFESHKGRLAYGSEDGSIIIIDCSHLTI